MARDAVEAERETDPEEKEDQALTALRELFIEVKSQNTHVIVTDAIVRQVRFAGWQATDQG